MNLRIVTSNTYPPFKQWGASHPPLSEEVTFLVLGNSVASLEVIFLLGKVIFLKTLPPPPNHIASRSFTRLKHGKLQGVRYKA